MSMHIMGYTYEGHGRAVHALATVPFTLVYNPDRKQWRSPNPITYRFEWECCVTRLDFYIGEGDLFLTDPWSGNRKPTDTITLDSSWGIDWDDKTEKITKAILWQIMDITPTEDVISATITKLTSIERSLTRPLRADG